MRRISLPAFANFEWQRRWFSPSLRGTRLSPAEAANDVDLSLGYFRRVRKVASLGRVPPQPISGGGLSRGEGERSFRRRFGW